MQRLWAPWRMEYIRQSDASRPCIFCETFIDGDHADETLIHRGEHYCILLNKYPYTNGHLLVAPRKHVANLEDLTTEELTHLCSALSRTIELLKENLVPDGFNVGMNIGKVAGAGIADHLHMHVVPRWAGDHNFMTVLGEARVINQHLEATRAELLPHVSKFFR